MPTCIRNVLQYDNVRNTFHIRHYSILCYTIVMLSMAMLHERRQNWGKLPDHLLNT
jgi:hypothetical protein